MNILASIKENFSLAIKLCVPILAEKSVSQDPFLLKFMFTLYLLIFSKNITPEDSTEENKENHRIKQGTFQPPQKKSARHIPVIEYLTVPEFEAVPKYVLNQCHNANIMIW